MGLFDNLPQPDPEEVQRLITETLKHIANQTENAAPGTSEHRIHLRATTALEDR